MSGARANGCRPRACERLWKCARARGNPLNPIKPTFFGQKVPSWHVFRVLVMREGGIKTP